MTKEERKKRAFQRELKNDFPSNKKPMNARYVDTKKKKTEPIGFANRLFGGYLQIKKKKGE